jgi:gliding motility-associated-like protein
LSNLDEILKKEMETFSPDAPNVWTGVKGAIGNTNVGLLSKISSKLGLSKTALVSTQIILIIATTTIIGMAIYSNFSEKEQIIVPPKQESVSKIPNKEELSIANAEEKQEILKPGAAKQNPRSQKKTTEVKSKSSEEGEKVVLTSQNITTHSHPENEEQNKIISSSPNNMDQSIFINETKTEQNNAPEDLGIDFDLPLIIDSVEVEKPVVFKIPGSFSPNDDGANDFFVILIEDYELYSLKIFNQKNEIIFESSDKSNCWDGKNQITGTNYPAGVYYFEFICKGKNTNQKQVKRGKFSLFR